MSNSDLKKRYFTFYVDDYEHDKVCSFWSRTCYEELGVFYFEIYKGSYTINNIRTNYVVNRVKKNYVEKQVLHC